MGFIRVVRSLKHDGVELDAGAVVSLEDDELDFTAKQLEDLRDAGVIALLTEEEAEFERFKNRTVELEKPAKPEKPTKPEKPADPFIDGKSESADKDSSDKTEDKK